MDTVTSIRSVNSTDAMTLLRNFGVRALNSFFQELIGVEFEKCHERDARTVDFVSRNW